MHRRDAQMIQHRAAVKNDEVRETMEQLRVIDRQSDNKQVNSHLRSEPGGNALLLLP